MEKRRRVLMAGPLTESSRLAAGRLTAAGLDPVALEALEPEPATAPEWGEWARYALALLVRVDGVVLLPMSARSRGVALICNTAHELAMPIRTITGWLTKAGQDAYMQRLTGDRT